jgi:hypothetical protein
MDELLILEAFRCVLSPDNEVRRQNESYLDSLRGQPGLFAVLIKLANSAELDLHLRQSAVVFLKNAIKLYPQVGDDLQQTERELLKSNLLSCIVHNLGEEKIKT